MEKYIIILLEVYLIIEVNDDKVYSIFLVFKFKNYELDYPNDIKDFLPFSYNSGDFKDLETLNTFGKSTATEVPTKTLIEYLIK